MKRASERERERECINGKKDGRDKEKIRGNWEKENERLWERERENKRRWERDSKVGKDRKKVKNKRKAKERNQKNLL